MPEQLGLGLFSGAVETTRDPKLGARVRRADGTVCHVVFSSAEGRATYWGEDPGWHSPQDRLDFLASPAYAKHGAFEAPVLIYAHGFGSFRHWWSVQAGEEVEVLEEGPCR